MYLLDYNHPTDLFYVRREALMREARDAPRQRTSGVLSDTSGGFPPLGIIGMMGGAVVAVSLLLLMRLVRTS
jgi:hypothetical protein